MEEPVINNSFPQISPGPTPSALPLASNRQSKPVLKIILGIIIGIVVLVGASVAVLASRFYDPLWNPFRPEPEQVIKMAMANMGALKAVHSETKGDFSVTTASPVQNVKLSFSGADDTDSTDTKNIKESSTINISVSGDAGDYTFLIQTKIIGSDIYFFLNNIDSLATPLENLGLDPVIFQGKWIKWDEASLERLTGQKMSSIAGTSKQEEIAKKIEEIISGMDLFIVKKELDDENISGNASYHYLVSLDEKVLEDVFSGIIDEEMKLIPTEQSQGIGLAMVSSAIKGMMGKIFTAVGEIDFDLWVGKKDLLVYKATMGKTIDLAALFKSLYGSSDMGLPSGNISINFDTSFSNFNKPVQVVAPESYVNLEEVVAEAMQRYQILSDDASIAGDMMDIQLAADTIYLNNKSYYNLSCKNVNVKYFCDGVKKTTGTNPVVRTSKTKYCAYAKLATPIDYFCIDNSGYYQVDISPAGKGYCVGTTFACPRKQGVK